MNMGGAIRSVYSPRSKSGSTNSPRQSRGGVPPPTGKKVAPIRSLDVSAASTAKRTSVSEEDITRIEKKIDSLFLKEDRGKHDQELRVKNEELQAALHELEETKNALNHMERKWQMAQKTSERLDKENKAQAAQLVEIREELMERRRKSIGNKRMALEEINVENQGEQAEDDENVGNLLLKQGLEREEKLIDEVSQLKLQLERERAEHNASIRDMLVAVKVAVGLREEAEAELASQDLVWSSLIRRWNGGTKRHSLLLWVQYKLTPYPSVNVSNFADDWRDGKAFCALVHGHRPDLVTRSQLQGDCVALATHLAEALELVGVPETLFAPTPDWNKVMHIVFSLYHKFSVEED